MGPSWRGLGDEMTFDEWYYEYSDTTEYEAGMRDAFDAGYATAHAAAIQAAAVVLIFAEIVGIIEECV
jgi:hypothetical protein